MKCCYTLRKHRMTSSSWCHVTDWHISCFHGNISSSSRHDSYFYIKIPMILSHDVTLFQFHYCSERGRVSSEPRNTNINRQSDTDSCLSVCLSVCHTCHSYQQCKHVLAMTHLSTYTAHIISTVKLSANENTTQAANHSMSIALVAWWLLQTTHRLACPCVWSVTCCTTSRQSCHTTSNILN